MAATLAGRLAGTFGDVERLRTQLHTDVTWHAPASLGQRIAGPHTGIDTVVTFLQLVWHRIHDGTTVSVSMLGELEQGPLSVARFGYSATLVASGETYSNDYVLLVRERDGKAVDVVENTDTLKMLQYESLRQGILG